MATTNGKTAARERAREAKAKVDKARVEEDKLIEEQATAYYLGSDEHDKALAAATDAETKMAAAVLALGDLDVPVEQVATLCATDARRVRQLRKTAKDAPWTLPDADETHTEPIRRLMARRLEVH